MQLLIGIGVYVVAVNIVAFAAFGVDKKRAQAGEERIPEATLLALAVLGGAPGAFIAMRRFHHKTKKRKFTFTVTPFMALQVISYVALVAFAMYVSDYYRADAVALEALDSSDDVKVSEVSSGYCFDGPGSETALVFYPGGKVETAAYAPLMQRLAADGIDCFLVDMPFHLAVFGVDRASAVMGEFGSLYDQWYVGGHSLGGVMAASFADSHAAELEGVVFLAAYPASDLSDTDLESVSVYGSNDQVLNLAKYAESVVNQPAVFEETVIEGGNHAQFGNYGEQAGDGVATISASAQQEQAVEAITSSLLEG